ncbi:MAG: histidine phosphatase family protein [Candidatus Hydrothermarchaeales archaeon]
MVKFHQNVPIKFVKDLREIYWGEWQGKTRKELGFTSRKSVSNTFPKDAPGN